MSVITATDVEHASGVLFVAAGDVVTPLARDRAKELGVRLEGRGAVAGEVVSGARALRGAGTRTTGGGASGSGNGSASAGKHASAASTVASVAVLARVHVARVADRAGAHGSAPRSGALYRRGANGLDGLRDIGSHASAADGAVGTVRPTVAIVGAGHVGAAAGIRLAESDLFERLVLIDVVDGLAAGLALDMWHSAAIRGFTTRVTGSSDIGAVAGADIVVITAGLPRKPNMTRTDLTAANAEIVRGIARTIRERAPSAVVLVVTNPVEEMTHLTTLVTGFPPERVIGMGGVLDTARFRALVGLSGVARPEDVRAIVIGSHGPEMVIPLSQATANGRLLEDAIASEELAKIVARTRESGAEVTGLLKVGSAFVSPGSAIARHVEAIVRGTDEVVPACVLSRGAYGIRDVRIGLPARLGLGGVREIVELPLRPDELRALRASADAIRERTRVLAP
jgi:malate dehydrogenase